MIYYVSKIYLEIFGHSLSWQSVEQIATGNEAGQISRNITIQ